MLGGRRMTMTAAFRTAARAIVLSLAVLCRAAEAGATFDWNNVATDDNNLGRVARSCSARYCHVGVSGLDLWVSLQEVSATILGEREREAGLFARQA